MKPDVWMPFYIAEYLAATTHLTTEQHGAYCLLLFSAWSRGGELPNDPAKLANIARMTPAAWKKSADTLLEFFIVDDSFIRSKRVMLEFEKAQRMVESRRENGAKGGRPKKGSQPEIITEAKPRGFSQDNLDETPTRVARPLPLPPSSNDEGVVVIGRERVIPFVAPNAERAAGPAPGETSPALEALNAKLVAGAVAVMKVRLDELIPRLREAAGDRVRDHLYMLNTDFSPLLNLMRKGDGPPCDLELDVLPTIARLCAQPQASPIRGWGYFKDAILEARDRRLNPIGAPAILETNREPNRRTTSGYAPDPDSRRAHTEARRSVLAAFAEDGDSEGFG